MGGFHLLMMLLGIIGCRFGDAGLRQKAVESDVVAEGSMERVLSGKHYNRKFIGNRKRREVSNRKTEVKTESRRVPEGTKKQRILQVGESIQ